MYVIIYISAFVHMHVIGCSSKLNFGLHGGIRGEYNDLKFINGYLGGQHVGRRSRKLYGDGIKGDNTSGGTGKCNLVSVI